MQLSKNTSNDKIKGLLIKVVFILVIVIGLIVMLSKIDFPSPVKKIEKFIPNENLKIVK
tara:strand:- start:1003 stop:1179 length:177 start_codon:yes stop_codon:yes gene_type:complete